MAHHHESLLRSLAWPTLSVAGALLVYSYQGFEVSKARTKHGIKAPAITGKNWPVIPRLLMRNPHPTQRQPWVRACIPRAPKHHGIVGYLRSFDLCRRLVSEPCLGSRLRRCVRCGQISLWHWLQSQARSTRIWVPDLIPCIYCASGHGGIWCWKVPLQALQTLIVECVSQIQLIRNTTIYVSIFSGS